MIRHPTRLALLLSVFSQVTVQAAEFPQLRSFHKDWEIACDDAEAGLTVLLTRAAGQNQNPRIQLELADTGARLPDSVQMRVAGRKLGAVKIDGDAKGELDATQTAALLAAVLKDAPTSYRPKGRMQCC